LWSHSQLTSGGTAADEEEKRTARVEIRAKPIDERRRSMRTNVVRG